MKLIFLAIPLLFVAVLVTSSCHEAIAVETESITKEGVKALQLGTGHDSISPGQSIEVGLLIQHLPEFHTYWKAPGIVGLPTSIDWTLPDGFSASEIEWPMPEVTKMAAYTCYGYERDVCLITTIQSPKEIDAEAVTLKGRVSYMCCAKSCHPGFHDFSITIPVSKPGSSRPVAKWQKLFAENRDPSPVSMPNGWTVKAVVTDQTIKMDLQISKGKFASADNAHFFCETNTVHSDRQQKIALSDDQQTTTFSFVRSEFAPKDLKDFTGLLFNPEGWPGTDSKWIEINTPLTIAKGQSN